MRPPCGVGKKWELVGKFQTRRASGAPNLGADDPALLRESDLLHRLRRGAHAPTLASGKAGIPSAGSRINEGIREEKLERKREETMAKTNGGKVAFIQSLMPVAVQLIALFIRALRNGIIVGMRWLAAVEILRGAMKAYL